MIIVGSRRLLLFPGGIVVLRELIRRLLLLLILRHVFSLIPASSSSSSRRAIGIVVRIVSLLVTITAVVTVLRPGVVLLVVRIKRILSSSAGVGVHNFPKGFWMMNSDVIGGAFFSLPILKSIVQKHKTPRRRRHSGSIDRNSMRHKKLVALRKKKGNSSKKGDARLKARYIYRKDEEEEEMRKTNDEAGFLKGELNSLKKCCASSCHLFRLRYNFLNTTS